MASTSLLAKFKGVEHSFAAYVEKELTTLFNNAPKDIEITQGVLKYAAMVLPSVVSLEAGPAAGAAVGVGIQDAEIALVALSSTIKDFGSHPNLGSAINAVANNLNGLLAAGHVSNTQAVSIVQRVVNELVLVANLFIPIPAPAVA